MPAPIIIWKIATAVAALGGLVKAGIARNKIKKARRKLENAQSLYDKFIIDFTKKHELVSIEITKLGELRLNAVELLGEVVVFLRNAKLKERDIVLQRYKRSQ